MPVIVQCPGCNVKLRLSEQSLGRKIACPKCKRQFSTQKPPQTATAAPVATAPEYGLPVDVPLEFPTDIPVAEEVGSLPPQSLNPYQHPAALPAAPANVGAVAQPNIPNADVTKIESVISDAKMVAVAILLCLLCTGIGFLIIGPWYFWRFAQWNQFATKYPALLEAHPPHGSLAQRFQNAKTRLIVGLVVGAVMFGLIALFVLTLVIGVAAGAAQ